MVLESGASRSEVLEEFNPQQSRLVKEASWDPELLLESGVLPIQLLPLKAPPLSP